MDLRYVLEHMKGSSVRINGKVYKIDMKGEVKGVKDIDAHKLLANREAWQTIPSRQPVPPEPAEDPVDGKEKTEDWPDPEESMSKAYLQDMAAAYEVDCSPKVTKKELVDLIKAGMYE